MISIDNSICDTERADTVINDACKADVIIQGLPYYSTCGVKAPRAYESVIKSFNSLSSLNMSTGYDFFDNKVIANPKPVSDYKIMESCVKSLNPDKSLIFIGGEHLVTLPIIKALKPRRVLIFDAHADYFDEYNGKAESYATVTKRVSESVDEVFVAGVRDLTHTEKEGIKGSNVKLISLSDVKRIPKGDMYISVDLDVLDPSHCPDVSTPVPLGCSMIDLVNALKTSCLRFNIKGFDICELTCSAKGLSSVNTAGIIMQYLWARR